MKLAKFLREHYSVLPPAQEQVSVRGSAWAPHRSAPELVVKLAIEQKVVPRQDKFKEVHNQSVVGFQKCTSGAQEGLYSLQPTRMWYRAVERLHVNAA